MLAPFLGSLVFEIDPHASRYQYSPYTWQMVLGIAMLLVIMFLPAGLWSLFARRAARSLTWRSILEARRPEQELRRRHRRATTSTSRSSRTAVVGLIGSNGAGKTTFINMVTGYLKPDSGQILLRGRDITRLPPRQITQLGICRSFQIPQLFNTLSVRDNMLVALGIVLRRGSRRRLAAASHPGTMRDREAARPDARALQARPSYRDQRGRLLPEGVRKLLDIAMAMVGEARRCCCSTSRPAACRADEKFALMDMVMEAVARRSGDRAVRRARHGDRRRATRSACWPSTKAASSPTASRETVLADAEVRRYVIGEHTPLAEAAKAADAAASSGSTSRSARSASCADVEPGVADRASWPG